MQPHTASERLPSMTTVLSMQQRNTSPASNTKHDKSADAAPESDTSHWTAQSKKGPQALCPFPRPFLSVKCWGCP